MQTTMNLSMTKKMFQYMTDTMHETIYNNNTLFRRLLKINGAMHI